jgi:peroxiredoxin
MAQLRQDYQQFIDRDAEVIAVGPENTKQLSDYWRSKKIPFIGIPDPAHTIAKKFGQEVNLLKMGRLPALFVIDKNGMIRLEHHGASMSDIPPNKQVLARLDELNEEFS